MADFPYSFAPLGEAPMGLEAYLDWRSAEFPALRRRAVWEIKDLPDTLTAENFWYQVAGPVLDVGRELCARMIKFCLNFVERAAERVREFLGGAEPNARQIMKDINALARVEVDNLSHEVWMYSRAVEHPVVDGAVTNAINNRWGQVPELTVGEGTVEEGLETPAPRRTRSRAR